MTQQMAPARPSLLGLSVEVSVEIAGRLAASSLHPMEDLHALRRICKDMRDASKAGHVGRCIPPQWVLQREQWKPYNNRRYLNNLINKLAKVGNTEACLCKGMRIMPLDMLECAVKDGHNLAAYTRAMCLYRRNGGAADDEKVMRQLRKLEGEEEPGAATAGGGGRKATWANRAYVRSRWEAMDMVTIVEPSVGTTARPKVAMPVVCGGHQCAGGDCVELDGSDRWDKWIVFCSKECRICFECKTFFRNNYW